MYASLSKNFFVEIETTFMPWLMEQASEALQKKIVARMMVDGKYSYNSWSIGIF